jgi:two-component system, OmpR family, sensor histidine kinase MtrB
VDLWSKPRQWPDLWRRSIQLRIVAGTLLMSAVVVLLIGWVMMNQVTEGVLESRREGARAEAAAQIRDTQAQLDAADSTAQDTGVLLNQLVSENVSRGADGLYDVVLLVPANAQDPTTTSARVTQGVRPESIPTELRNNVAMDPNGQLWDTYTEVRYDDGRAPQPALVVGAQVRLKSERFELYYLFPLAPQQQTLDVVQRALATAGFLLVILLGAVAWLVTRQVVTPVRMARRIAERFAAGRLEERMQVRGTDDLARLAISFNQMASNLQRQIRQLEELSRLQRRFVSDVSHELRTPLTTVRMAADLLHESRDDFDPVARRSVELLQNELNRFEALLADLLEISRFDAGAAALELDEVDLRDIVHRVVEGSQTLLAHRGAELTVRMPDEPVTARVDQRRIERILRNLVGNAIEHSEGRPIEVFAAVGDDAVAVAVRDHGVGFRAEEADMVFSRFWRADPARARTTGGTGLGLSIALEDARLHGGGLDAWGSPGEGAWFRLTLPRQEGDRYDGSPLPARPPDAPRPTLVGELVEVGAPYQRLTDEETA